MPELTIEKIKSELTSYQGKVEEKVKELISAQNKEYADRIDKLNKENEELKKAIAKVDEEIKKQHANKLPGYEGKENKWSWGAFIEGVYKKAIGDNDPWKNAGHEKEALDAYSKVRNDYVAKTNTAGDGSAGGYLIMPEVSDEIIGMTIANMPIMGMGVTKLNGLVGDLVIPAITSRPTGYMVGENEKPTASSVSYAEKIMKPHKCGAFSKQSNRLIYQSRNVSDMIIKQALSEAMSLKMNEMLTLGNGSEKQPLGIMKQTGFTTSTAGTAGAISGRARIDHLAIMQKDLDVANELVDNGVFGYLMRPEVLSGLKRERIKQYSEQTEAQGQPIMAINPLINNKMLADILGYDFKTTTQISATDPSGTYSSVVFGNWTKFWVGLWRDLIVKVSDVAGDGSTGSAFLEDMMYIVSFQEFDCHVVRPTAFTKITSCETNEASW